MDMIEKIKDLIATDNTMNGMQKSYSIGFIADANDRRIKEAADRKLIEELIINKNVDKILLSTDKVKIYSVISSKDEWDIKYPIRSIYLNDKGKWVRNATVSPTLETAFLSYLEKSHLGSNSQFSEFALKMLGINIDDEVVEKEEEIQQQQEQTIFLTTGKEILNLILSNINSFDKLIRKNFYMRNVEALHNNIIDYNNNIKVYDDYICITLHDCDEIQDQLYINLKRLNEKDVKLDWEGTVIYGEHFIDEMD